MIVNQSQIRTREITPQKENFWTDGSSVSKFHHSTAMPVNFGGTFINHFPRSGWASDFYMQMNHEHLSKDTLFYTFMWACLDKQKIELDTGQSHESQSPVAMPLVWPNWNVTWSDESQKCFCVSKSSQTFSSATNHNTTFTHWHFIYEDNPETVLGKYSLNTSFYQFVFFKFS